MSPNLPDKRRYRVTFRVTALERQTLDAAALTCGLNLSAYARAAAVFAKPMRAARKVAVEAVLLARILARLGVIASALTEIARAANKAPFLASTERELLRCLRELRPCRVALMRALGRAAAPT